MPGGERAPPRLGCVGPKPLSSVYVPRNISMPSSAKMNMTRKRIMNRFMICEIEHSTVSMIWRSPESERAW